MQEDMKIYFLSPGKNASAVILKTVFSKLQTNLDKSGIGITDKIMKKQLAPFLPNNLEMFSRRILNIIKIINCCISFT